MKREESEVNGSSNIANNEKMNAETKSDPQ